MSNNTYNPGSVAASYISSAIERLSALPVVFNLPDDSTATIMADLEKAMQILSEEDLPEMEYDEFMELIGEDAESSFDPFDSFDEQSQQHDLMIWADEYDDGDDNSAEIDEMRREMMRLQDELRTLKDAQRMGGQTQFEESKAEQYEAALTSRIAQREEALRLRQQGIVPTQPTPEPLSASGVLPNPMAAQGFPIPDGQGTMAGTDYAAQQLALQQQQQQQQTAQQALMQQQAAQFAAQQAAARQAAQQGGQQTPLMSAGGQQRVEMNPLEDARAKREHQKLMTEQQKKRAAARGANAAVMPSAEPVQKQTRNVPDTYELDIDPATVALDLNIDHVPFSAAEFDIRDAGVQSSMYIECWNKSIGEWDVGTLLSEEALDVCEFQITGNLVDGSGVLVSWNADNKIIMAQVSANHKVGVLTEATVGTQRQRYVKTGRPDVNSILEEAPAYSAAEALSYLSELEISTISFDIIYNENNYTLYFSDHSADVEASWVQDSSITANELAYLVLHISGVLAEYAVPKGADKVVWNQERQNQTRAGWYHMNKTKYSADVNKARTGAKMILNLSTITVSEEGILTVKQFSNE